MISPPQPNIPSSSPQYIAPYTFHGIDHQHQVYSQQLSQSLPQTTLMQHTKGRLERAMSFQSSYSQQSVHSQPSSADDNNSGYMTKTAARLARNRATARLRRERKKLQAETLSKVVEELTLHEQSLRKLYQEIEKVETKEVVDKLISSRGPAPLACEFCDDIFWAVASLEQHTNSMHSADLKAREMLSVSVQELDIMEEDDCAPDEEEDERAAQNNNDTMFESKVISESCKESKKIYATVGDDRRTKRLKRNAASARLCRQRKKMYIERLRVQIPLLRHNVEVLREALKIVDVDLTQLPPFDFVKMETCLDDVKLTIPSLKNSNVNGISCTTISDNSCTTTVTNSTTALGTNQKRKSVTEQKITPSKAKSGGIGSVLTPNSTMTSCSTKPQSIPKNVATTSTAPSRSRRSSTTSSLSASSSFHPPLYYTSSGSLLHHPSLLQQGGGRIMMHHGQQQNYAVPPHYLLYPPASFSSSTQESHARRNSMVMASHPKEEVLNSSHSSEELRMYHPSMMGRRSSEVLGNSSMLYGAFPPPPGTSLPLHLQPVTASSPHSPTYLPYLQASSLLHYTEQGNHGFVSPFNTSMVPPPCQPWLNSRKRRSESEPCELRMMTSAAEGGGMLMYNSHHNNQQGIKKMYYPNNAPFQQQPSPHKLNPAFHTRMTPTVSPSVFFYPSSSSNLSTMSSGSSLLHKSEGMMDRPVAMKEGSRSSSATKLKEKKDKKTEKEKRR